jgi:hypothetical protein
MPQSKQTSQPLRFSNQEDQTQMACSAGFALGRSIRCQRSAGRGRPPAAAARRAGLEEGVTSRSHQRIDRPLLPELPPSGWQVLGTCGQAGLGGHTGIHSGRTPWTAVRLRMARRPPARPHSGPCAAAADMVTVRPDTGPEPLLLQATAASKAGRHDWCPAGSATPTARVEQALSDRRHGRTLPLRPSAMPSRFRTPADTLSPSASLGGCGG